MSADQDVEAALNGVQADGSFRPWAWVRVRARTVFGNLAKNAYNLPFTRTINGSQVAATPSALDHLIGTSEQTSWVYVASDGHVYNLKDFAILLIEDFLETTDAAKVAELKAKASTLRPWPADYPAPAFER